MKSHNQQQTLGIKANLMKYLNLSTLIQPKAQRTRSQLSNMHCRSMEDLDLNLNGAMQSSKENVRSNAHHSSLYNEKQNGSNNQNLQNKSRSLSKFITFFENSSLMNQVKKQANQNKKKNYNGFSYDLKGTGNLSGANQPKRIMKKKDKQNINYQTLSNQRQLNHVSQIRSPLTNKTNQTNNKNDFPQEIQKIYKLRQTIEGYKQRESVYTQRIAQFQLRQRQFTQQIKRLQKLNEQKDKKLAEFEEKIKQLQQKNKETIDKYKSKENKKSSSKQSRQQSMVIKSLKKVINEQLNKIIELEKFRIENQYLKEKLGNNGDESFSQSNFSQSDYSFQHETEKQRKKQYSMGSTIRSSTSINQFGKQGFKKTKNLKDDVDKASQRQNGQHSSRHFKSFFQVEQSPMSQSEGNIMNIFKPYESRTKNTQNKSEKNKSQTEMIKICEPESSFTRQAIQEVNEENYDYLLQEHRNNTQSQNEEFYQQKQEQDVQQKQQSDSILQQVNQYLTKWRNQ